MDITAGDLLFALLIHILIISLLVVINFWSPRIAPKTIKTIQVQLISSAELKKTPSKPKKVIRTQKVKQKPKKVMKKIKKKPVLKLQKKKVVKKIAPKKKPKKIIDDFDPFQPLASVSDRKAVTHKKTSPNQTEVLQRQLSQQELDHYIAMIQRQVQEQWRVPSESDISNDPVVNLELNRDGSVRNVIITLSSGSANLDLSLLRAIRAAAPFTLPDKQFEVFRHNTIRFHPIR
ncbi:MAG: cell envelope integrity protein TolA [Mariprofundaceae bacterium]